MAKEIKVGIIGGTGLDNPDILEGRTERIVTNTYGKPSDALICGTIAGIKCVILSRHGRGHKLSPTYINYRANICALKEEGCNLIIVTTACGSLREEIKPGHFVVLDQLIDRTLHRDVTFYDQKPGSWPGVCHIPASHPFCPKLQQVLQLACKSNNATYHPSGTAVTIEGPRFSTYAESRLFQSWGADMVNMTAVPEAFLAKEAGILYGSLALATDYDCWRQNEESVHQASVVEVFKKNVPVVLKILQTAVKLIGEDCWDKEIKDAVELARNSVMGE